MGDELQSKVDTLEQSQGEIEKIAKDIENERDFYFNKVVAIENRLKEEVAQDSPLLKHLFEILYQTEEDARNSLSVPPQGNEVQTTPDMMGNNNNNMGGHMAMADNMEQNDIGM